MSHRSPPQTHDPFRGIYDAVFRPDGRSSSAIPPLPVDIKVEQLSPSNVGEEGVREETNNSGGGGGGGEGDNSGSVVSSFLPDERLTLEEAVWIYTAGGAVAAGADGRLGAVRPGFLADLTVVEVQGGGDELLENPRSA